MDRGYLEESLPLSWTLPGEGCLQVSLGGHIRLCSYNLLVPESLLGVAPQGSWRGSCCTKGALQGGQLWLQLPCVLGHRRPSQVLALHLLLGTLVQFGRVCTAF